MRAPCFFAVAVLFAALPVEHALAQAAPIKPVAPVVKVVPLAPSPLAPGPTGQVVISESSVEYLIALAGRLTSGDAEAELHLMRQMLAQLQEMKSRLQQMLRACEAQRALGKPCEHEAA